MCYNVTMKTKHDWTKIVPLMGHHTDRELADQFSIPRKIIANKRCQLGIPSVSKWDKFHHLLGTMLDRELAALVGNITPNAVTVKRHREGIPPHRNSDENILETYLLTLLPVSAQRQVRTPVGIIDVLTDEDIYECKVILTTTSAHMAIGQLLSASILYPNRRLWIVYKRNKLQSEMQSVLKTLDISIRAIPAW